MCEISTPPFLGVSYLEIKANLCKEPQWSNDYNKFSSKFYKNRSNHREQLRQILSKHHSHYLNLF